MNSIVILNSIEAISDLLEKRSGNYSSRPVRTMIQELYGFTHLFFSIIDDCIRMGWDWLFSSMPYGNHWKVKSFLSLRCVPCTNEKYQRHRNLFQKHFPINGTSEYHPLQINQTHVLLRDLERSPR